MRILSTIALAVLAFTASAQSYTITGKASSGKTAFLVDQSAAKVCDSCTITDGAFKFENKIAGEKVFEVNIDNSRRTKAIVLATAETNAAVDFTARPATVADNGGYNDKLTEMMNAVGAAGNAVNAKIEKLMSEGKSNEEIGAAVNADIEAVYDIYRNAINDNKENIFGAYVAAMTARQFYPTLKDVDELIATVKYAGEMAAIKTLREGYIKAEATQAGKMYVDFAGLTVDGKPSKLSDYVGKGKYVLVDFWASWCGPCKGEIPNLIELQNKFGGEKFTVLGVNVWDEETAFKAALTEEGITYPQIYIPRDNKDNATELYGIQGIPQIILFGPDGVIVQRDLRGQAMKDLVEEKMK
ncbi:MAG: redoxin domain-containing protein [Bacteroidaceae bacterium]|nr:redoxin domain-containing protein [Bacteroidaceae bacterium]